MIKAVLRNCVKTGLLKLYSQFDSIPWQGIAVVSMGVPFEALLPYGIMLTVCPGSRLYLTGRLMTALICRCSVSLELVWRACGIFQTITRDQGEDWIYGIGKVLPLVRPTRQSSLYKRSDGPGHAVNRRLPGTDGQPRSTAWLRSQQSVEGMLGMLSLQASPTDGFCRWRRGRHEATTFPT